MSSCELLSFCCIFVVLIQMIFGLFRWFYCNALGPQFGRLRDFKEYGEWALITGATSGIGLAYARAMAKRGLNVILVSRSLNKLLDVANEIEKSFHVKTAVIDVDFTSGYEIYDKIRENIHGKNIGVLVNNVGISYTAPDYFLNIPDREKIIKDLIQVNVASVSMVCSIVLPQMVERRKGLIINISSISAVTASPNLSIYSATKAFVGKLSEDLNDEYTHRGITIQCQTPGFVDTEMTKIIELKSSIMMSMMTSPEKYVEEALKTVGYSDNTAGYFPHWMLLFASNMVRYFSNSFCRSITLKQMAEVRELAIKRGLYMSASND